jgi:hypothetical protein
VSDDPAGDGLEVLAEVDAAQAGPPPGASPLARLSSVPPGLLDPAAAAAALADLTVHGAQQRPQLFDQDRSWRGGITIGNGCACLWGRRACLWGRRACLFCPAAPSSRRGAC